MEIDALIKKIRDLGFKDEDGVFWKIWCPLCNSKPFVVGCPIDILVYVLFNAQNKNDCENGKPHLLTVLQEKTGKHFQLKGYDIF
jgi:hypothetical protein